MTMPYSIQVRGVLTCEDKSHIKQIIDSTFEFIHLTYDHWNPSSEISQINRGEAFVPINISSHILSLFEKTETVIKLSQNRFDPTLGVIIDHIKKSQSIQLDSYPRWDLVQLDQNTLIKNHSQIKFDFDGVVKGLAVDMISDRLRDAGYSDTLVDWSGEMKGTGKAWNIAIRHPHGGILTSIKLKNQAIATSGDYVQQMHIDGEICSHIIDPVSKDPIKPSCNLVTSAICVAPSCCLADGLATATMLINDETELLDWVKKNEDKTIYFWVVTRT